MAADQNQSKMKPRMWLATRRRAKLGAGQPCPGETRRTDRARNEPRVHLTGPVRSAGSSGLSQARPPRGTQSCPAPAAPARALYTLSADPLLTNYSRLCFLKKNLKV